MKTTCKGVLMLFMALIVQMGFAQNKTVTGNVTDEENVPLPGVTVMVKGTTKGTSTDFDGNYEIEASNGDQLEFSYIGYENQSLIIGDSDTYNLQMNVSDNIMDEVLVVAYGRASRESITGSVSSISSQDIKNRAVTNVFSALEGSAPGIQFNANSGQRFIREYSNPWISFDKRFQ